MATGTITTMMTSVVGSGFAESFNFFLGGVASPDVLDGMSAELTLYRSGRPASEAMVYGSQDPVAYLSVAANTVTISVPRSVNAAWPPGTYDVTLRVIDPASSIDRYTLFGAGRLSVLAAVS